MKFFSTYIGKLMTGILAILALTSCVYDDAEDFADSQADNVRIVLRINTLSSVNTAENSSIVEMIRSLRIIIIDESGYIDVNDRIVTDETAGEANGFDYTYMRVVSPGKKNIYLVANEESVSKVGITDYTDLPTSLPLTNLTSLLSYYSAGSESTARGKNLERVLNRVYFETDYSIMHEGDAVYLPYSSMYEITINEPEEDSQSSVTRIENPLYLVPAAVKMDLTFVNYRKNNAQVDDVILYSFNSHNYLNAQLDEKELFRTFNGEKTWWVDWLEACAKASQTAADNEAFNKEWGWIKYYRMPLPAEQKVGISLNPGKERWVVDALVDKNNPDKLKVGPFYLPESLQLDTTSPDEVTDPDDMPEPGDQVYTMTFVVHNEDSEDVYTLPGNRIPNLRALFRATHVEVTVEFHEDQVEIYAEVGPWVKRRFQGYVQEEV